MPKLILELNKKGLRTPLALGGIIPNEHHKSLLEAGISYVMAPRVSILGAIPSLINLIKSHRLFNDEELQKG